MTTQTISPLVHRDTTPDWSGDLMTHEGKPTAESLLPGPPTFAEYMFQQQALAVFAAYEQLAEVAR